MTKKMKITISDDFDLEKIINSGQCFRGKKFEDNIYRFITHNQVLYIQNLGYGSYEISCTLDEWKSTWFQYFDFGRSYHEIRHRIPIEDTFMRQAASVGLGIRILQQDPWETLVSFIISQRKSIPAIEQSVELLASAFGTSIQTEYEQVFLFPTAQQLAGASEEQLKACKLGYRIPYVQHAVSMVNDGLNLMDLYNQNDFVLLDTLKTIKGVGDKVANCVSLFAYNRTALAPVDTWIKKIISENYSGVNPFPNYGDVAGIMQQYAFYYAIQNKKKYDR